MKDKELVGLRRLHNAVINFVEKNRGRVVVIGGVRIEQYPGEEQNFYIAVKCTGRKPELPKEK